MQILRALSLALLALAPLPATAQTEAAASLRLALNESGRGNWQAALQQARSSSAVGQDIIQWQRLRAGTGTLTEYEDFLARRPDWPGMPLLHEKGETAVARASDPGRVLAYFGQSLPQTGAGSLAVIRALLAQGRGPEAEAEARRAWVDLSFSAEDERQLFQLYPGLTDLHADRLSRLLWQGRTREAERMLPRVSGDWAALARARIALLDRAEGVTRLVDAVPAALAQHPLLAHARMDWRIWRDLWPGATELMLAHSETAALLGSPEAWAKRRAQLARQLLRDGDSRQAYRIAARHSLTTGGDYADLEFLAGFIALRRLNDAETAYRHFRHLEENVSTPISLSRAYYWQGRALEAMGDPGADATYRRAAEHQTAYYGQLAAERLGLPLQASLLAPLAAPDWRSRPFAQSSVLEAALLLLKAGDRVQGKRFILHLAESLSAADLASLAALALQIHEPHIAVLLGKQGAERGIILPDAYFPQTPLVPDQGLSVSRPLALAISRRESEFDVAARSPAGARGLMQLMPETARRMAADRGEAFDPARLTTDPAYNARLGTAYLAALVQEFGPSVALVASGYNAGPGRPRRWITEFGDPRRPDVDVVDWVEMIPFAETRTYVMRVSESLTIYRAKLRGSPGPVRLTAELKG